MAYADDLIRLRKSMVDALALGVLDESSKDLYEATLIQIMNEAEKQRQSCVARAEDMRRQAAIADGQSHAFTQVSSIVYSIISGYVGVAERQRREEQAQAAERAEKEAAKEAALAAEAARAAETTAAEAEAEEDKKRKRK